MPKARAFTGGPRELPRITATTARDRSLRTPQVLGLVFKLVEAGPNGKVAIVKPLWQGRTSF